MYLVLETYTCVRAHTRMYTGTDAHTCISRMCARTCLLHMDTCMCAHTCVSTCVHRMACMHAHTCACILCVCVCASNHLVCDVHTGWTACLSQWCAGGGAVRGGGRGRSTGPGAPPRPPCGSPLPALLVARFTLCICLPASLDGRGLPSTALLSGLRFHHKCWRGQKRGSPGSPSAVRRARGGD